MLGTISHLLRLRMRVAPGVDRGCPGCLDHQKRHSVEATGNLSRGGSMRIRHVLAGATVLAGGLLLTACDWGRTTTFSDSESLSGPVSEVRFANDSGDVKIAVGDTF